MDALAQAPLVIASGGSGMESRRSRCSTRSRPSSHFPVFFKRRDPPSFCCHYPCWSPPGTEGSARGWLLSAVIVLFIWPADLSTPNVMRLLIFIAQCLVCSALMGSLHRSRRLALSEAATRRASESALRRSDALQSAVLTAAFDCIITLDDQGRIIEFNPAAEQTFGLARSQAIGRGLDEVVDFSGEKLGHEESLSHQTINAEQFLTVREPDGAFGQTGGRHCLSDRALDRPGQRGSRPLFCCLST